MVHVYMYIPIFLYLNIFIIYQDNFNPSEKMSQWEGWHPIYEMENKKIMFETTNQIYIYMV